LEKEENDDLGGLVSRGVGQYVLCPAQPTLMDADEWAPHLRLPCGSPDAIDCGL